MLQAQEIPDSARQITLDVSERLEFSDNPDLLPNSLAEDRVTARTTLLLNALRRTGTDSFEFNLGGDLEIRDDGDNGIVNPLFGLSWGREVGRSEIGLAFDVREVELGTTTGRFFDEDTGSIDFGTRDRGTRRTTDLSLEGAFGIDMPFGGNYAVSQREIRYSGTDDPDLLDADRQTLEGDLFFVLDPRITVGIEGSYVLFDEAGPGAIDTEDTAVGVFTELGITQTLTGRFGVGYQKVDDTGARVVSEDGIVFNASLEQELPRSTAIFDTSSEVTDNGRRNEVSAGQRLPLSTGEFDYSIGLTKTEGFDTEPLFNVGWSQELARGVFSLTLDQRAFSGRGDEENRINSRLAASYDQQLTNLSSFGVAFSVIDRNEQGEDATDSQRVALDLIYRHALTQDWDLTGGISLIRSSEDGAEDEDANTVFIGLERRFVWN